MRRTLALLLLFSACAMSAERLRVLSYNIHHGEGVDGRIDLERIAVVIRSVSPDIVALQEVDRRTERSKGIDQAQQLGWLTGMQMIYGKTLDFQGGLYGNALLTRLNVLAFRNHPLPGNASREKRGVIEAELGSFRIFATHLDIAEADRVMQARRIVELAGEGPALLAGDLNAVPTSEPMRILSRVFRPANGDDPRPTIPVAKPARQIDYVMLKPADSWRVVEVRVLDEAVASDHRGILAVLELLDR